MTKYGRAAVCVVSLLFVPSALYAQDLSRAWVDVNFISAQSNQDVQEYATGGISSSGTIMAIAQNYPEMPRANGFDVEGGYTFAKGIGFGVRWIRARYDYTIATGLAVAHPITGQSALDAEESDEAQRTDSAIDLMATYTVPLANPAIRVRLFGGPTYFNVEQEMVSNVSFVHAFNLIGTVNAVSITNIATEDVDGSAWGYNVGGDVAYFFTRHVGVGAGLRYNAGTVKDVDIPLPDGIVGDEETEFDTGHLTFAVGVRFRF